MPYCIHYRPDVRKVRALLGDEQEEDGNDEEGELWRCRHPSGVGLVTASALSGLSGLDADAYPMTMVSRHPHCVFRQSLFLSLHCQSRSSPGVR